MMTTSVSNETVLIMFISISLRSYIKI